jgi:hypothetical protein
MIKMKMTKQQFLWKMEIVRLSLVTLRLNEMAFHHIELIKCIASIFNILCTKLTNWNKDVLSIII